MRIRRRACSICSRSAIARTTYKGLNVTICGDVRHSRVARSDIDGLVALGAGEIRLCGPARTAAGAPPNFPAAAIIEDFDAALAGSDVVIMLRLQKERMQSALGLGEADYFAAYGLTPDAPRASAQAMRSSCIRVR